MKYPTIPDFSGEALLWAIPERPLVRIVVNQIMENVCHMVIEAFLEDHYDSPIPYMKKCKKKLFWGPARTPPWYCEC